MKKGLAFILFLITLTAVFTPCCGYNDCGEETLTVNKHPGGKARDSCSPFVTCDYCPGFTQLNAVQEILIMLPDIVAHYSRETDWFSSAYTDRLLQPPKPVWFF